MHGFSFFQSLLPVFGVKCMEKKAKTHLAIQGVDFSLPELSDLSRHFSWSPLEGRTRFDCFGPIHSAPRISSPFGCVFLFFGGSLCFFHWPGKKDILLLGS